MAEEAVGVVEGSGVRRGHLSGDVGIEMRLVVGGDHGGREEVEETRATLGRAAAVCVVRKKGVGERGVHVGEMPSEPAHFGK